MSRTLDTALKAVAKAAGDVERWETRTVELAAALAEHEASAGALLIDDPSAEDRIAGRAERLVSQRRAAESALTVARHRLHDARHAALLAEAVDEDEQAQTALREHKALEAAIEKARVTLEELDGAAWRRITPSSDPMHESADRRVYRTSRLGPLLGTARRHTYRAGVLRFVAENGHLPAFTSELDVVDPLPNPGGRIVTTTTVYGDLVPDSAREFAGHATTVDA